jgi:hypothetical protein
MTSLPVGQHETVDSPADRRDANADARDEFREHLAKRAPTPATSLPRIDS